MRLSTSGSQGGAIINASGVGFLVVHGAVMFCAAWGYFAMMNALRASGLSRTTRFFAEWVAWLAVGVPIGLFGVLGGTIMAARRFPTDLGSVDRVALLVSGMGVFVVSAVAAARTAAGRRYFKVAQ